jgi:hypothetical protein
MRFDADTFELALRETIDDIPKMSVEQGVGRGLTLADLSCAASRPTRRIHSDRI